jgi:hypothetical protein
MKAAITTVPERFASLFELLLTLDVALLLELEKFGVFLFLLFLPLKRITHPA